MPSYERFVALMPRVIMILAVLLHTLLSKSSNIVFKGIAALGKIKK